MFHKAMSPAFSPSSLKELEPTINEYIDQFIAALTTLSKRDGGVVDMNEWFFNLMLAVCPEMV